MTSPTRVSSRRPSAPPGCERAEVVGAEAARIEQRDGERVTERECRGGAGGGGKIERAGFFGDGRLEVDVGFAGQRRLGATGDRDQPGALALDQGHDGQHLFAGARVRQRDHDVLGGDHAHVTVGGLGRMHEVRRRARARQGGREFAGDMPRLADAGDDHTPATSENQLDGTLELRAQTIGERGYGGGFNSKYAAGKCES